MQLLRPRTALAAVAAAGALAALTAPSARAAFDVTPLGCAVQPDPGIALAVFGYANPNPDPVAIELGAENLVLQPPNFRAGQPTTFAPGTRRAAWAAQFAPADPRSIELWWYLQGAIAQALAPQPCASGAAGPDAPDAPRLLRDGEPLAPGAAIAAGDALTVDTGAAAGDAVGAGEARLVAAFERCAEGVCQPVPWGSASQEFHDVAFAPRPYVVGPADAGSALRVRLVVATADGWSSALSASTGVVAGERPAPEPGRAPWTDGPPVPVVQPSVADPIAARRGVALVADPGQWAGGVAPAVSGRWERCDAAGRACAAIEGATAARYVPTAADVGQTLRWATRASASGLQTTVPGAEVVARAASAPTAVVADGVDPEPPGGDPPGEEPPGGDPPGGDPPGGDPPAGDGRGPADGPPQREPQGTPPPTADPPGADRTPPAIRSLRLTRTRFRVGSRPTAVVAGPRRSGTGSARRGAASRAPRGTELRFSLSEAAFVRIDVERLGGREGGRVVATVTRVLPAGPARVSLSGRFPRSAGGALPPGRYRVRVQARDLSGNRSAERSVAMRVVR